MVNRRVASEEHAASVIICLFNLALASLVSLARGTGQTCRTATKWQMHPRHLIDILVLYVGTQWMMTSVDDGNFDPTLQKKSRDMASRIYHAYNEKYTILPPQLDPR
ncbi:hypothetical protein PENSUB_12846 [Penicillium subrubescens]|jgi:hypothetical protein|uniref:Uncharacterized protein n=1 Tax=Penicillium subrubescens TaxID=1316194 RepID=A0A1Q5SWC5_9EURO|nr:hypothetical protein PENSUB_12846 [Penicillium subrubescens]